MDAYAIDAEIRERLAIQADYERFRHRRPWRWLPARLRGAVFSRHASRTTPPQHHPLPHQ